MVKMCRYDGKKFCWRSSCDVFNPATGSVDVCELYGGGHRFRYEVVKPDVKRVLL